MECRSVLFRSQNLGETERAAVERVRAIVDRGLPGLAVEFETAAGKPVGEAAHGRSEILRLVDIIGEIVVPERDIGLLAVAIGHDDRLQRRSEEHTSELQSLMRISYAVFCLQKKKISKYLSITLTR